jgi:hypothetical protein
MAITRSLASDQKEARLTAWNWFHTKRRGTRLRRSTTMN